MITKHQQFYPTPNFRVSTLDGFYCSEIHYQETRRRVLDHEEQTRRRLQTIYPQKDLLGCTNNRAVIPDGDLASYQAYDYYFARNYYIADDEIPDILLQTTPLECFIDYIMVKKNKMVGELEKLEVHS